MVFLLFKGFDDLIQFLIIQIGELVDHGSAYFEGLLSDAIDDELIVLILTEENIFEFLEDKKTVIFIGETHLLYLLFSKQIFKEATVIPIGFGFGFAKIRDRVEHAEAILVYDFKL